MTVERLGGVGGAVSVDYQTSDGSATAGADYAARSGTLNWAAGDERRQDLHGAGHLGRPRRRHRVAQPGADEPRRGRRPGAELRGGHPHRRRRRERPAGAERRRLPRRRGRRPGDDHRDAGGRQPRWPGLRRLRDQRRHGDRGLRLRGRRGHAHLRSGRGEQELHRPRDERHRARRRRGVPGEARERRRRREPRVACGRHRDDRPTTTPPRSRPRPARPKPRRPPRPARLRRVPSPRPVRQDRAEADPRREGGSARAEGEAPRTVGPLQRALQARGRREAPDRQAHRHPGPCEGDRARRQDGEAQGQALEEGAGQAAQGDETRKGQGRALRPCHGRRRQPGCRVPAGSPSSASAFRRAGSGAARCPSRAPRRRSRRTAAGRSAAGSSSSRARRSARSRPPAGRPPRP